MPISKYFPLTLLASSIALTGCNSNDHDAPVTKSVTPTRTVLIYMVGSDLESKGDAASNDLAEMMKVGSDNNLNIIVETGGANKDGWKTVKRYLIHNGSKELITDLGNKNMGLSETLRDFLDWGMKTYSTDKYSLVFWDHGGGAVGNDGATVGLDENFSDALSLPEIKQALTSATQTNNKLFDFVGFDTCLMATLETASTIAPFANYMVASEETEPSSGWDYTSWLGAIKTDPTLTTLNISKKIVDSYFASFATGSEEAQGITLTAIQLNKVSAVNTQLATLAQKLGNNLNSAPDSVRLDVARSRERSESYGKQHGDDSGMVDLNDLSSKLPNSYQSEVTKLQTALTDAIAYSKRGSARPNANGLSIYLPSKDSIKTGLTSAIAAYKQIGFGADWVNVVDKYSTLADADNSAPSLVATQADKNFSATITGNDISEVSVYITAQANDGSLVVLARESADSFSNGVASYKFDNKILALNGNEVYYDVVEQTDDSLILGVPAKINDVESYILINVSNLTGDSSQYKFTVIGAIPSSTNGVVERLVSIEKGDIIKPQFLKYDANTDTTSLVDDDPFTITASGLTASIAALPTGTYNLFFVAEDYSGNTQNSNVFTFNIP